MARSTDRGELRRPPGADRHGGPKPGARRPGFLRPQLDTAPFPNYFVVEPPSLSALAVALLRSDSAGGWRLRAASSRRLAIGLGAWGLFGLVRRRDGEATALAAVVAFSLFPITLRYGRAFQPDALMLGACWRGLDCWDAAERGVGPLVAGPGLAACWRSASPPRSPRRSSWFPWRW